MSSDLPRAESKLEIVGAPFYNDRTSQSHSCLKQCSKCGTYYNWSFSYEFLVNGTEDEIYLTRLTDEKGEKRAKNALAKIKSAEDKFRAEAESRVKTLLTSKGKGIYGAANFLQGGQFLGHDIEFAALALLKALIRISKMDGDDDYLNQSASLIYFVLREVVKESQEVAREVFEILRSHKDKTTKNNKKQVDWLIEDCRETLKSRR